MKESKNQDRKDNVRYVVVSDHGNGFVDRTECLGLAAAYAVAMEERDALRDAGSYVAKVEDNECGLPRVTLGDGFSDEALQRVEILRLGAMDVWQVAYAATDSDDAEPYMETRLFREEADARKCLEAYVADAMDDDYYDIVDHIPGRRVAVFSKHDWSAVAKVRMERVPLHDNGRRRNNAEVAEETERWHREHDKENKETK